MHPIVLEKKNVVTELCRRFGVARLEIFGSAAGGQFEDSSSDLDFLVEFSNSPETSRADQYFGLLFALEELFGRPIDLVCARAMRNPYFIKAVNRTRMPLYAA